MHLHKCEPPQRRRQIPVRAPNAMHKMHVAPFELRTLCTRCTLSFLSSEPYAQDARDVGGVTCSALSEGELQGVPGVPVLRSSPSPITATTGPTTNGLFALLLGPHNPPAAQKPVTRNG